MPTRIKPRSRLFTAADLPRLPNVVDGMDTVYELFDGELVFLPLPSADHSISQGLICYYLTRDCEFKADAAFVLKASLPVKLSREGYLLTIPEIIVEVRSKNDSLPELTSKCEEYLEAGTVLVWVPDPRHRTISEYRRDAGPRVFQPGDTLTCDLLPGFAVPVLSFFDE
jgi:Uma2 family endonuclease